MTYQRKLAQVWRAIFTDLPDSTDKRLALERLADVIQILDRISTHKEP